MDFRTVQLLQTRNPSLSRSDLGFVREQMNEGTLFPTITDATLRWGILCRLEKVTCIIPSLFTFLEDTKWLEPSVKVMRNLLPPNCRESTYTAFSRMFLGRDQQDGTVPVLNRDQCWSSVKGNEKAAVDCGYRQLWMFSWRHFPDMVAMTPRKDSGKAKPPVKSLNEQCLHRLAQLADKLGFDSPQLKRLIAQDPDVKMASAFLQQARPAEYYSISTDISVGSVTQICNILRGITSGRAFKMADNGLTSNQEPATEYRCGRPYEGSHSSTKSWFFPSDIYKTNASGMSHFTVNCDIFRAFFGFTMSVDLNAVQSKPAVLGFSSKTFDFSSHHSSRATKSTKRPARRLRPTMANTGNSSAGGLLGATDETAFDEPMDIDLIEEEDADAVNQPVPHVNPNEAQMNDPSQGNAQPDDNNEAREPPPPQVREPPPPPPQVREPSPPPQVREPPPPPQVYEPSPSQEVSQLNLSSASKRSNPPTDSESGVVYKNLVAEYEANCAPDNLFFVDAEEAKCQVFRPDNVQNIWACTHDYVGSCVIAAFNHDLKAWKTLTPEMVPCMTVNKKKGRDGVVVAFRTRDESKPAELILAPETIFSKFGQSTTAERLQAIEDRWRLKRKKGPDYWTTEIRAIDPIKRSKMQTTEVDSTQLAKSYTVSSVEEEL